MLLQFLGAIVQAEALLFICFLCHALSNDNLLPEPFYGPDWRNPKSLPKFVLQGPKFESTRISFCTHLLNPDTTFLVKGFL